MKIQFTNSFLKSLKKINFDNNWYIKIHDLFRYNIPNFIRNIYSFRKELWQYRTWDSVYSLMFLKRGLEQTARNLELYGHEVDESRLKKVEKIKRTVVLLNNFIEDNFIEQAEKELGINVVSRFDFVPVKNDSSLEEMVDRCTIEENKNNYKVFNKSFEMEKEQWKELIYILQGQDKSDIKISSEEEYDDFINNFYDGSGILDWWD